MKNYNLVLPLIFFISSCSYNASFRQDFMPMTPSIATSQQLDGKGLIVMSAYDENLIYSDNPSSFTGGATTLNLPIGQIVKRISLEVFSSIFAEGAYFDNQPSNSKDYILVIKPDVKVDSYKYDQLENLGFAVTPKVSISANIQVLSSNQSIIFNKNYSYVDKKSRAYLFAGSPDEKINELIHQSIHQILLESLTDIRTNLIEN